MKDKIIYVSKGFYCGDIGKKPYYSAVISEQEYNEYDIHEPHKIYLNKYICINEYEKIKNLLNEAIYSLKFYQSIKDLDKEFTTIIATKTLADIKKEMGEV
jgi:hypothetical protein